MSFRCDFCGYPEAAGVTAHKVVTKVRHKRYANTSAVGSEIVEEKTSCRQCYDPERQPEVIPLAAEPSFDGIDNSAFIEAAQ